ncbi:MAG: ABC transporter permease subunit [Clostridiaceae bacterium]|nr:ABC transporter permease subunit [Clostridia bacterium]MDY3870615.1 ABC transporter permease subunit [Clostridiaceae bacterium]
MTVFKLELRQGKTALIVWTAAIGFLLAVCIFLFPEMKGEMDTLTSVFASMGSFTAAFGMDRLNFGELSGFYAIECGNILGLGGAFFAALTAVNVLAKEEKDRTAEFLLTHPVCRGRVLAEKLCAVLAQITAMNAVLLALSLGCMAAIGEDIPWRTVLLLHLGYFLLQTELAGVCFGISAFIRRSGPGIGLGLAAAMYFLNLISNLSSSAEFLRYVTPFAYCEGADIISSGELDTALVLLGLGYAVAAAAAGCLHYTRKDIR